MSCIADKIKVGGDLAWQSLIGPYNSAWGAYLREAEEFELLKVDNHGFMWRLVDIRFSTSGDSSEEGQIVVISLDLNGNSSRPPVGFHYPDQATLYHEEWKWENPYKNYRKASSSGGFATQVLGPDDFANGQDRKGAQVVFIADGNPTDVMCGLGWDAPAGYAHRSCVLTFQQFPILSHHELTKRPEMLSKTVESLGLQLSELRKSYQNDVTRLSQRCSDMERQVAKLQNEVGILSTQIKEGEK